MSADPFSIDCLPVQPVDVFALATRLEQTPLPDDLTSEERVMREYERKACLLELMGCAAQSGDQIVRPFTQKMFEDLRQDVTKIQQSSWSNDPHMSQPVFGRRGAVTFFFGSSSAQVIVNRGTLTETSAAAQKVLPQRISKIFEPLPQ